MADKSRYKKKFSIQHIGPTGSNRKPELGSGDRLFDHDRAMFSALIGLGLGGIGGAMYAAPKETKRRMELEEGEKRRHWTPRIKRESDDEVLKSVGGRIEGKIK